MLLTTHSSLSYNKCLCKYMPSRLWIVYKHHILQLLYPFNLVCSTAISWAPPSLSTYILATLIHKKLKSHWLSEKCSLDLTCMESLCGYMYCNPITWVAKQGGSWFPNQSRLQRTILSKTKNIKEKNYIGANMKVQQIKALTTKSWQLEFDCQDSYGRREKKSWFFCVCVELSI